MEKPTLEVVLRALDALYRGEDTNEKEKASLWLMQLQASVHAWEVADQLLLMQGDMQASYFAAQTMQSKVRFSFEELPAETHVALRDSILNHLQNLREAPLPITRQLAMALADLALQMTDWNSVVTDLIQRFSSDISTVPVLLDVLIVLPEEINNRSLRLGHNRRKELRIILGKDCTSVLSLLAACLTSCSNHPDIQTRVFACLGSWVQLGNFPVDELAQSDLFAAPFHTLCLLDVPQKLYEAATDCICSTLFMCDDITQYYSLAMVLQTHIKKLLPVFQAAVQSEDSNRSYCLCRIFTELAETFLYYTVLHPNSELGDLTVYDMLLECVSHPDYEIADITFNVWYRLSEELVRADDIDLTAVFKPYIQRLISHLCVHCQLDEDGSPTSVPDEGDDFAAFRDNVAELIKDVIFIFGSLTCFTELYANICRPGTTWNVSEACLFIMHAVAASISLDESEVLPIAVPVLLSISPDAHYSLRATTLRLVAELAEWIDKHPDTLDLVLKFLLDGLHIPAVSSFAAKAVQKVCEKCKDKMALHFNGLLQIIEAADNLSISNEAVIGLLKGATEVLTRMSHEQITSGVRSLCSLQAAPLTRLSAVDPAHKVQSGSSNDPTVWIDRLSAVFRGCVLKLRAGETHPCTPVVHELWPILESLFTKYKHDQRITERACRCVRFIIRGTGKSAAGIISPLVTMMVSIYRELHHSCFLYLGSIIVDEFGEDESYQQGLIGMLQAFAEQSFPLLAGPTGLVNNPDTVDDMFRLCARFLQRCPLVFLSSAVAPTVIQCALAATTINHRDAFTSVMKFHRDLIRLPENPDLSEADCHTRRGAVQAFLQQNGQLLLNGLVSGFISLPTFMIAESTEVLWELLQFAREDVCQFLRTAVDSIPVSGSVSVTDEQKVWIIETIAKCEDLDSLYPTVKDLARLYR